MNVLISGGCKNGKSSLAQKLAVKYAEEAGRAPVYFATMIPHDEEDLERIRLHREDRKDQGFETLECRNGFASEVENLEEGRVVLLDSLTALLAGEIFEGRKDFSLSVMNKEVVNTTKKIEINIEKLIKKSASVIFVCDKIYNDGKYDEITELYRKALAEIERFTAEKCQKVLEMNGGKIKTLKDSESRLNEKKSKSLKDDKGLVLIIGGACQGKTDFARKEFSLSDQDIFVCKEDSAPDFSKKCLTHFENYVSYALKNNLPVKSDFFGGGEKSSANPKIIICNDIFCGLVPMDPFQRKVREECGRKLQEIAKKARLIRLTLGRAEEL
ncbi:MAG: bifunctional adenosylcobinamide kinase/adenosylcobinamide-phosphate guanylyltransferase [Treponema sp.]|nr:bifunctional adenosylcobinamide kinase/adenosylcobinamide-phosphate guanylyltransferase [Treponema sp.]